MAKIFYVFAGAVVRFLLMVISLVRREVSRYCRYEDAVEGHEMTVEKLRRELNENNRTDV